jgi:hypothetical protein
MEENYKNLEDEISDLKHELEHFQQEKERVRVIIGKIGGVPKFRTKLVNILFIVVVVVCLIISVIGDREVRLLMIELTTVMLSLKIIYLIHCQNRINHFKFWILSSIEWRINELMKQVKKQSKQ